MKVNRNVSVFAQYILDEWIPPRIRDSKWFMSLPMKLLLKDASNDFMNFKDWIFNSDSKGIEELYKRTLHVQELQGETDLNKQCINEILDSISYNNVLEVGAGRAYLANIISRDHKVTACDIVIPSSLRKKYPKIKFVSGDIENLPFRDNQFETVITTHTLEHTQNLPKAISELRRVAKNELIVVVPRQRPYKYTFSLHTQFFPYKWSLINEFGNKKARIEKLGDWFYYETVQ